MGYFKVIPPIVVAIESIFALLQPSDAEAAVIVIAVMLICSIGAVLYVASKTRTIIREEMEAYFEEHVSPRARL